MFVVVRMPFRLSPYAAAAATLLVLLFCATAHAQDATDQPATAQPLFEIGDYDSTNAQLTGCPPDKVR